MAVKKLKYSKAEIADLNKQGDIRKVIPNPLTGSGATQFCTCPECGKKGKGKGLAVTYKPGQGLNIAKCFSCGFSLVGPVAAHMYFKGYSKDDYVKAIEETASITGYFLKGMPQEATQKQTTKKRGKSFCQKQLEESGLTEKDVTARWLMPDGSVIMRPTMTSGGVEKFTWQVNESDDEMIIHYLDLEGAPMKFQPKGNAKKLIPYIRVRWSVPELNVDEAGKPIKYQTGKGAPVKFYIPQVIRSLYQDEQQIETLFIQEGEKKAEKACKHGMLSIGIQGIYNIGNEETGLIKELQYLVRRCKIKNVVMIMDSDWDHLSKNIHDGSSIDSRPRQFAKAVIKFKDYVDILNSFDHSVDIWWGHVNENDKKEKGVDDILVGSLKGKEADLMPDVNHTMLQHDGKVKYLDIHKISSKTDYQIYDYWSLNDKDKFLERYSESLKDLKKFRFGRIAYRRTEDGGVIADGALGDSEKIWTTKVKDDEKKVNFDIIAALSLLKANGFRNIHTKDLPPGEYRLIKIENQVVYDSSNVDIRNFLYSYVLQTTKDKTVHAAFAQNLGSFMGQYQCERLEQIEDNFSDAQPDEQIYSFRNCQVMATPHGIKTAPAIGLTWSERRINRDFSRVPLVKSIEKLDESTYEFTFSPEAYKSDFFVFLANTCNFSGTAFSDMTIEETKTLYHHLVNKMTSIGYLLTDYKYMTEQKTIVAMDDKVSEVGKACGRSGKSLIGKAIEMMTTQAQLDGKKPGLESDEFIFSEVTPKTRNIFIDDVRQKFSYERFFNQITGNISVNPKGAKRFSIDFEHAPKFYITTNHAISDNQPSTLARIAITTFSDHYNINNQPIDEFGRMFFSQWDAEQWNLFYNLMIECVHYYLHSMQMEWQKKGWGIVLPPMENVKRRNLRQRIGEAFLQWAETAFDPTGGKINQKLDRQELYKNFHEMFPGNTFAVPAAYFRDKLEAFCEYSGLHLNINRPHKKTGQSYSAWKGTRSDDDTSFIGDVYKSNSHEYYIISTSEWADAQPY